MTVERPTTSSQASFNVGYYGLAQIFNATLAMILIGFLARTLGRTGFGEFSFAFVVASIGAIIADFGLGPWLTRASAREPAASGLLLSRVLRIRLPLLILSSILLLGVMALYLHSAERLLVLSLMMVYVAGLGYAMIYESLLMGRGEVRAVSSSLLAGKFLELLLVGTVLLTRPDTGAAGASLAMAVACVARVLYVRSLARRSVGQGDHSPLQGTAFPIAGVMAGAFPFAAGLILWTVYSKVDVLLLERLVAPDQLGIYTAAYRVLEALFLIPRSIVGVHFPIYAEAWTHRRLDMTHLAAPMRLLLVGSGAAAVVLIAAPGDVLRFLFGPDFSIGMDTMRILGLALVPLFLNQFQAMYLGATDRQSDWLRNLGVVLVVNVLLNLTLIPRLGIQGAAIATLSSEMLLLTMFLIGHGRELMAAFDAGWVLRAGIAVLTPGVALLGLHTAVPIRFVVAGAVFIAAAVLLRLIHPRELANFGRRVTGRPLPVNHAGGMPEVPCGRGIASATAPELSVVMLTFNSEQTLEESLSSASFAGERLIIDSGSSDATLDIARRCGARILERPMVDGWAAQRNFGHAAARGSWVLALDSDEILGPDVIEAISRVVSAPPGPGVPTAWSIRVLNYFLGRPLRHGGLDRDDHVRLVRRDAGQWAGDVHEQLRVSGTVGHLPGEVKHLTGISLEQRLVKCARYAHMRSRQWRAEGRRPSAVRTVWEPLRLLIGRLIIRGGWRDGLHGVVWWWLQATELLGAHFLLMAQDLNPQDVAPKISDSSLVTKDPESHVRT